MKVISIIIIGIVIVILLRIIFRKILDLPNYSGSSLTDNCKIENLFSESRFWEIINEVRDKSKRNYVFQCQLLTEYLEALTEKEIIQFDRTFTLLMAKSYSFKLWEPVYSLNGGCSDDAFEYFRSWLIAQGKNKFYWTQKYPRLLILIGVKEIIEHYEGFAYCANQAYQNKTSQNIPQYNDIHFGDGGTIFKESEAFFRYPELALLAW